MYLKNIIIENNWPIDRLEILEKDLFKEDWEPKILILTWKNWSWKTVLMSNIADSFFEFASQNFSDVLPSQWLARSYYRVLWWSNQKTWTDFSFSFINFEWKYKYLEKSTWEDWKEKEEEKEKVKKYEYLEKTWDLTFQQIKEKTNSKLTVDQNWKEWKIISNLKKDEDIKEDFLKNTYCFFPVSRFENPHWLNDWKNKDREQIKDLKKYNWKLNKPIIIENSLDENKSWILDIFLDFLTDYEKTDTWYNAPQINLKSIFKEWKNNLEKILSKILQKDLKNKNWTYQEDEKWNNIPWIEIKLNFRNNNLSRLKLIDKESWKDLIPSLDNLSWWQSLLLNMFSSIIRLSDQQDLNKSIHLNQIEWIVLIDEIDLSLHIDLQKEVLPELLSLFPRIQFIITSHSPFFLLWMEEKSKKDWNFQYQIIKMPNWEIYNDIKWLEEVGKAYWIFEENFESFKKEFDELNDKIKKNEKPLIITEWKTDWKYFLKALQYFHKKEEFKNIKEEYFLKYWSQKDVDCNICWTDTFLEMCDTELKKFLENLSHTRQKDKNINKSLRIWIFDSDNDKIKEIENKENNIYWFLIEPKGISTEFLFSEDEIKTEIEIEWKKKRLFIWDEFDKTTKKLMNKTAINVWWLENWNLNKCWKKVIIENDVFDKSSENIALSKNEFSKNIFNWKISVSDESWEKFKPIFEKIENVINQIIK